MSCTAGPGGMRRGLIRYLPLDVRVDIQVSSKLNPPGRVEAKPLPGCSQQPVAPVLAIGAVAKGVNTGVAAPASTTIASPVPGPTPDGPLAEPQ
jgi:hypothetical protein